MSRWSVPSPASLCDDENLPLASARQPWLFPNRSHVQQTHVNMPTASTGHAAQYPWNEVISSPWNNNFSQFPPQAGHERYLYPQQPQRGASVMDRQFQDNTKASAEQQNQSNKWTQEQTTVLVSVWKDSIHLIESSKATAGWQKVVEEVNKAGPRKTVKQCKKKIGNLKSAYKDAKKHNGKTGRNGIASPYYDDFDDVYGTRPVMTMPGVIESSKPSSSSSTSTEFDGFGFSEDEDEESRGTNTSFESADSLVPSSSEQPSPSPIRENGATGATPGPKRKAPATSCGSVTKNPPKKRARKATTSAGELENLTEKMVAIHTQQMEMIERSQSRTEELLLKLEEQQRKSDEESRQKDQEFLLRLAELLKK